MADLASIRQAHPEYNDLSDQQLSDALYAKFYSDMPRADFDRAMASPASGPTYGAGESGSNPAAGLPVTVGQRREIVARGGYFPDAPLGTTLNPTFETPFSGEPETGAFVPLRGGMVQRDVRPLSETLIAGAGRTGLRALGMPFRGTPMGGILNRAAEVAFPSGALDAAESGATSAALLGGKNELAALPYGIGAMAEGKPFSEGFQPVLSAADERDRVLRENHPGWYYGGGAAGTAATAAVTPVIRGGSVATRVLGNAAIQGSQGAAAGFLGSDGDLGERGQQAAIGGFLGGILGGGGSYIEPKPLPPSPITTPLPSGIPPSAARRAARYVERQSAIPLSDLEAFSGNPSLTAAEVMGQRGKRAIMGLGAQEGTTPEAFAEIVRQRAEERPQVLMDAFASATGMSPAEAGGDIDAIIEAGRNEVAPMFKQALQDPRPVTSDRLKSILGTPEGKKAARQVYADMLNDIDGPPPAAHGFEVTGATPDGLPETVTASSPTMEAWDRLYKQLGRQVERDTFGKPLPESMSPGNRNLDALRRALRSELENVSPGWGAAMAHSADYKSAEAAFKMASKSLFAPSVSVRQFAKGIENLSATERRAAISGHGNAIFEKAQNSNLRPNTFKAPHVRDKMRLLMGDEAADKLIAAAKEQADMAHFENRFGPNANSTSADKLQVIKEQNDNPWKEAAFNATMAIPLGPKGMAAAAGIVPIRRLAAKITAPKSEAWRDYAGQLLLGDPQTLAESVKGIPQKPNRLVRGAKVVGHTLGTRLGGKAGGAAADRN